MGNQILIFCFVLLLHMLCQNGVQLLLSGNDLLYNKILFKIIITIYRVSWRRMQNPIFNVVV